MRFLVNPECYHRIFNRREDDFTSLRAYNDYLEEVETLTFNLLHSINVSETELKLSQYASQNASSIAHNVLLSTQETASQEASSAADKERARLRRDAVRREAEEEKSELEEGRREIINQLANDQSLGNVNAEKIAREGQKVLLKRSSARRYALQGSGPHGRIGGGDVPVMIPSNGSIQEVTAGSGGDTGGEGGGLFFKGLKPRDEIEQQKNGRGGLQKMRQEKYDPFGGLGPGRRNGPGQNGSGPGGNGEEKRKEYEYFTLQHHYLHPWLEQAEKDPVIQAGGYNLKEYYQRALVEAFAGLGVMVGDEMGRKEDVNIGGGGGSGVGGSGGEGTPSTVEVAVKAAGNAALTRVGKEDGVL
ncbi:MAG: hypothetical protein M1823_003200 [Watsoniomyces obsoletus]|nr:MAG: hypothetical protein M1823_003200 [Watsoniomyces obsoletus]